VSEEQPGRCHRGGVAVEHAARCSQERGTAERPDDPSSARDIGRSEADLRDARSFRRVRRCRIADYRKLYICPYSHSETRAYLKDVLERIVSADVKAHQFDRLLPWTWKAQQVVVRPLRQPDPTPDQETIPPLSRVTLLPATWSADDAYGDRLTHFHNRNRMHSTLGYMDPMTFKEIWRRKQNVQAAQCGYYRKRCTRERPCKRDCQKFLKP
jgi:hypothetical protein